MNYYVYGLLRKGEHRPFYIGATHKPGQRKWAHSQKILLRGVIFDLVILETLYCVADAAKLEAELIHWYRARGVKLMNASSAATYYGPRRSDLAPP